MSQITHPVSSFTDDELTHLPTLVESTNLAILISGRGSNLPPIIEACATGTLGACIQAVISNKAEAPGLDLAHSHGIPTCIVKHSDYPDRETFDRALLSEINKYAVDHIILAGFMRILSPVFINPWQGKLLNIHPSLLPLYPGLNTHARALASGDAQTGASVHFVTPQLDGGPVILQGVVDIESDDSAGTLATRVLNAEHTIYPMAIDWLLSGRVTLQNDHCLLDGVRLEHPPRWYDNQLLW